MVNTALSTFSVSLHVQIKSDHPLVPHASVWEENRLLGSMHDKHIRCMNMSVFYPKVRATLVLCEKNAALSFE